MASYEYKDSDGVHVEVWAATEQREAIISLKSNEWVEAYVTREDAPAIALAILEAAGFVDTGCGRMSHIVRELRADAEEQEAAKRESEDLKALDSEAQQYYVAAWGGGADYKGYHTVDDAAKTYWRNIAIKGREIHGASK